MENLSLRVRKLSKYSGSFLSVARKHWGFDFKVGILLKFEREKSGRVLGVRNLVGRLSEKLKRGKESRNSGD